MTNSKDKNLKYQVKVSFLYKGLSIAMSFLMVKYMLQYLGVEKYGIWSVILAIINWVLFFDLGIANGIKNKISSSLSTENTKGAQEYISTGYIILSSFSILIYIIFFSASKLINWQNILNIYSIPNSELNLIISTILFLLLTNFVLSIILAVVNAVQKSSLIVKNQFLSQLISFTLLLILIKTTNSSLLLLSISFGSSLIISNIILSIWFYKKNSDLSPKLKYFSLSKSKSLSVLGANFFILQLTILIILMTDRMIITQLLGPSHVSNYDVLHKYFSAITIIHTIINTPLWPMYTEAHTKNDFKWISKTLKKMHKIMCLYLVISFIMVYCGSFIINLWLNNNEIVLTFSNYVYMAIMILVLVWHQVYSYFSNGIEKTKIQLVSSLIGAIANIPLSIYFVKYMNMGINGVILATALSLGIFCILGPIQAYKELKHMRTRL